MKTTTCFLFCSLLVGGQRLAGAAELFLTSDNCEACHNGLVTPKGEDVSIGVQWRGSMMANAARDPYWQATVRRETREHAPAGAAIEHECSTCHMPMAHVQTETEGRSMSVFAHLARGVHDQRTELAQDGVSCSLCHQIEAEKLGSPESFVGGFVVDTSGKLPRKAMGPFAVKPVWARLMASATEHMPSAASHLRSSEMCATCHTLITESRSPDGKVIGRLPEQVPYLEWRESRYREGPSCEGCHMPEVSEPVVIANLLSEPRQGICRHEFVGGNFVSPALLKRLGTAMPALPQDLDHACAAARRFLAASAAKLFIGEPQLKDGRLEATITVESSAGHKLPTAYPSRRAWLHLTVKDRGGGLVFESGAVASSGRIAGNDNDDDEQRFEPHRQVIEQAGDVQIYEAILGNSQGQVTTGLLQAVTYLKDNRIVPPGFDKHKAHADVAVHGEAQTDQDFAEGKDCVLLRVPVEGRPAPFRIEAELLYQPIGYRWAENLRKEASAEARAFGRAFDAVAASSFQRMAKAER